MSTTGRSAGHGRAHADAGEAGLGDRRVEHALGAELLHQAGQHLEGRAGFGHVLAHDEDARIAAHLLGQRFADGFAQRQFANWQQLLQAYTSSVTFDASGYGAAIANCTAFSISACTSASILLQNRGAASALLLPDQPIAR